MSNTESNKYFDLHTSGIGYLNRVREISPFLKVDIAALRGSVDDVKYTYFKCYVAGKKAQEIVRNLKSAVDDKKKVLIGFTLSDLLIDPFIYEHGDKAGEAGVNVKSRLLRVAWAKVDGQLVLSEKETAA